VSHNEEKTALSRRAFVGKVAAGAAVAMVAGAGSAKALANREPQKDSALLDLGQAAAAQGAAPVIGEEITTPAPWELLAPLSLGAAVVHGWSVAGLSGVANGSCVLTLQNERGRSHRIHVCRNDGRPQGLVYTNRLDLVVMNGGQGDLPTEEGLAQAVAEVAHVLAANERRHENVLSTLLPQAERLERFASAAGLR
jgi:hypothetical protein